ncbi:MAG: hypothetical protein QW179_00445 [Candidatus Hadarchaeales archaeon]
MKPAEQLEKRKTLAQALPALSLTVIFLAGLFAGLLPVGAAMKSTTLVMLPASEVEKLEGYLEQLGGRKILGSEVAYFEIPMEFSEGFAREVKDRAAEAEVGGEVKVLEVRPASSWRELLQFGTGLLAATIATAFITLISTRRKSHAVAVPLFIWANLLGACGVAALLRIPFDGFTIFPLFAGFLLSLHTALFLDRGEVKKKAKEAGIIILLVALPFGIFGALLFSEKVIYLTLMLLFIAALNYLNTLWASSWLKERKKVTEVKYHVSI